MAGINSGLLRRPRKPGDQIAAPPRIGPKPQDVLSRGSKNPAPPQLLRAPAAPGAARRIPRKRVAPAAPVAPTPTAPQVDDNGLPTANGGVMAPLDPAAMVTQARSIAQAQLAPQFGQVDRAQQQEQAATNARMAQIGGLGLWQQNGLDKAYSDAVAASNNLIAQSASSNGDAQKALQAALSSGQSQQDQLAATMGGAGDDSQAKAIMAAAMAQAQSGQQNLAGQAAVDQGALANMRGLAGVTANANLDDERRRDNSVMSGLNDQRSQLAASLGDLTTQTTQSLREQEINKAENQQQYALAVQQFGVDKADKLFQQYLAKQELGLKTNDQSFQQYLAGQELGLKKDDQSFQQNLATKTLGLDTAKFKHDAKVDWANIGISQQQANAQIAGLAQDAKNAKDAQGRQDAQARAGVYTKAYELLSTIMAPTKGESAPPSSGARFPGQEYAQPQATGQKDANGNPIMQQRYQRRYSDVVSAMRSQGIPADVVYNILRKSQYPDWAKQAQEDYTSMKDPKLKKVRKKVSSAQRAVGDFANKIAS